MTLDEAVAEFRAIAVICHVREMDARTLQDGVVHDLCSGGIRQKKGGLPALYLSADDAIDNWLASAEFFLQDESFDFFRFIHEPKLNKYQITMAELPRITHRVADDRYSVESQIMVKE